MGENSINNSSLSPNISAAIRKILPKIGDILKISCFVSAAGFNLHERGGQNPKKKYSTLVFHNL